MKIKKIMVTVVAVTVVASSMTAITYANVQLSSSTKEISSYTGSATQLSQTATGFASGVTGGGNISESSSGYVKVSTAAELGIALKKGASTKVIEIVNDIDLGWNMIGTSAQTSPFSENNAVQIHPTLKKTGVSKVKVDSFDGLTIYSKNGAKLTHAGFTFKACKNIIIQNLQFDELWEWDEDSKGNYDTNDWDFMTLETCSKVWIDHCTFGKAYDGVIDSKKGTSGLTISWSRFLPGDINSDFFKAQFDYLEANQSSCPMYSYLRNTIGLTKEQIMKVAAPQKKTHLVGSTEFATDNANLEVTLCYNYYLDSQDRMPRLRGGNAHVFNIVMDSTNAYEAGKILTDDMQTKITSAGYHFGITSNGALSTEGGAVCLENCIIKGIKYPLRNNQKDEAKTEYTGKIIADNCKYIYDNINYTGNSTDANSPLAPVPAAVVNFSWDKTPNFTGTTIPYSYTLYTLNELESKLASESGTTSGGAIIIPPETTVTAPVTTEDTTTEPVTTTSEPIDTDKVKYGDVDLNGIINISDVIKLNKYLVKSVSLNATAKENADCVHDGKIEIKDNFEIVLFICKIVSNLGIN